MPVGIVLRIMSSAMSGSQRTNPTPMTSQKYWPKLSNTSLTVNARA